MKYFLTEWRRFLKESEEKHPKLLDVPDIRQFNDYTCGSASLLAVLYFYGLYDDNEKQLTKELDTNSEEGTSLDKIQQISKKYGLTCKVQEDCEIEDLQKAINSGHPVILNFQAWSNNKIKDWKKDWKDGHYAVLIGIDDKKLYIRDPSLYNKVGILSIDEFKDRWHDVGEEKGKKLHNVAIFFSGKKKDRQKFEKIQ